MKAVDRLFPLLPAQAARLLAAHADELREIRLRAGKPVQIIGRSDCLSEDCLSEETLHRILAALMDYSVHTREAELAQGFFTMDDGSRVGVCGRISEAGGKAAMTDIGSACIRIARDVPGCADALMPFVNGPEHRLCSLLVVSPPGLGKTTMLRDIARQLSRRGFNIAVADDRHELAACCRGVPTIDLGPRTDVIDGCTKDRAIGQLLRAMSPDAIVTDEIGGPLDAQAVADAARCGAAVIASAHASSLESLGDRPRLADVLATDVFKYATLLGYPPGTVAKVRRLGVEGGRPVWKSA